MRLRPRTGRPRLAAALPTLVALALGAAAVGCGEGGDGPSTPSGPTSTASGSSTTATAVPLDELGPSPIIRYLQHALDALGFQVGDIDGVYGPETEAALKAFQQSQKLPTTGALDSATVLALAQASPEAHADAVGALQTELTELGLYQGEIDEEFGPATAAALRALQRQAGLPQTGELDQATFAALQQRYVAEVRGPTQAASGAASTTTSTVPAGTPGVLSPGDQGPEVLALQQRLAALGYRPGAADGRYGPDTESAVMAFEKHEGLSRDGQAGPEVLSRLDSPTGAGPRSSAPGPRVEVDLDRQIAFVVDGSGTVTILNVSTGSGRQYTDSDGNTAVAYTPTGDFTVYEKDDGPVEAPLGTLYRPLYFVEGWAMHGSSSVPGYPASHGCVRVSDDDQDFVFPLIPVGAPISIYGTSAGDGKQGAPGF